MKTQRRCNIILFKIAFFGAGNYRIYKNTFNRHIVGKGFQDIEVVFTDMNQKGLLRMRFEKLLILLVMEVRHV